MVKLKIESWIVTLQTNAPCGHLYIILWGNINVNFVIVFILPRKSNITYRQILILTCVRNFYFTC